MKVHSLMILCFILLLVSACSGQPSLPTAVLLLTSLPASPTPLLKNTLQQTTTPRPTSTPTDTPFPPTATLDISLTQTAIAVQKYQETTAQVQAATASYPMTATAIVQLNQASLPSIVIPDAWVSVRALLPSDILVYMPTVIPARFPSPEIYEVETNDAALGGPVYTIGYYVATSEGDSDTLVFILNNGQGSWGAEWTGPGFVTKSITVDGVKGEFYMIPGENSSPSLKGKTYYRVSWKKQGQNYEIKAISSRMTEVKFMQIVQSVIQLKK